MRTSHRLLPVLLAVAVAVVFGTTALATGPQTAVTPQIDTAQPTAPDADTPQADAEAGAQSPADDGVPFLQPDTPQPELKCSGGYCSSTRQCQWWYGPDYICYDVPDQSCGICVLF